MGKSYWIPWIKAAGVRALKTAAQAAVALIGTNAMTLSDVNWVVILSAAGLAAVVSLLMSTAGLPELAQLEEQIKTDEWSGTVEKMREAYGLEQTGDTQEGQQTVDMDDSWAIEDYSDANRGKNND